MQKAINNLISNAFKYTKAGEQYLSQSESEIGEVLIEITDNGSGIAEKDIDKIFNRFIKQTQSPHHIQVLVLVWLSLRVSSNCIMEVSMCPASLEREQLSAST